MNRKLNEFSMLEKEEKSFTKCFTLLHFNDFWIIHEDFFLNHPKIDHLRFVFLMNRLSIGVISLLLKSFFFNVTFIPGIRIISF